MTAASESARPGLRVPKAFVDGAVVAKRNLIKIKRVPDLLVFSTLSPIMFILLFSYVFGSAIPVFPGASASTYREFLMAGIFVQTVIFGATITGAGLADDIQKGIIDRFRSLPMSSSAVLVGRTTSDLLNNVLVLFIMTITGLIVGWRIRGGVLDAIGAYLLLLAFAYAISWVMALIGLIVPTPEVVNNASFMVIFPLTFIANTFVPTPEVVNNASFMVIFPLTFIANTFVPTQHFPTVLKAISNWNPVSAATKACRDLFGNPSPAVHTWPLEHAPLYTLLWVVALVAVFLPLSVRRYSKAAAR